MGADFALGIDHPLPGDAGALGCGSHGIPDHAGGAAAHQSGNLPVGGYLSGRDLTDQGVDFFIFSHHRLLIIAILGRKGGMIFSKAASWLREFLMPEARDHVVVYQPNGLHVGVAYRWADELHATTAQGAA